MIQSGSRKNSGGREQEGVDADPAPGQMRAGGGRDGSAAVMPRLRLRPARTAT